MLFPLYRIRRLTYRLRHYAMMIDELETYYGTRAMPDSAIAYLNEQALPIADKLTKLLTKRHECLPKEEALIREYFPSVPVAPWHIYKRGEVLADYQKEIKKN